jgi:hypothetical protein
MRHIVHVKLACLGHIGRCAMPKSMALPLIDETL